MKNIGIYIHIPFCDGKCPYCDFYSKLPRDSEVESYVAAVKKRIYDFSKIYNRRVDTVYFGGGTPNLIGGEKLAEILLSLKNSFDVEERAEITVEANPNSVNSEFFFAIRSAGFNRLSMGLQSANEDELKLLGRKHSAEDVVNAVRMARGAGFDNISLDLMMGLPGQTESKLKSSVDFCSALSVEHISSYILKVEERTAFYKQALILPDDDAVSDLYLFAVDELAKLGYNQYEISNFSKPGFESKHNMKYWRCEEYLGIGPAAHSFMQGERFYFDRNIKAFIDGCKPIDDGIGGGFDELVMLRLRLAEGLSRADCETYGMGLFDAILKKTKKIPCDCIKVTENNISLTAKGFLISNSIIFLLTQDL